MMNKYEKAKAQVKAQEIADKVLAMDDVQYERFIKKLKAEIEMLNAGVEESQNKIDEISKRPKKEMGYSDNGIFSLVGAGIGFLGSIILCSNQLAPINFADVLIACTSALGSAGVGLIAGALAAVTVEANPVAKGINAIQKFIQGKRLNYFEDRLYEKNAIMDEVLEGLNSSYGF